MYAGAPRHLAQRVLRYPMSQARMHLLRMKWRSEVLVSFKKICELKLSILVLGRIWDHDCCYMSSCLFQNAMTLCPVIGYISAVLDEQYLLPHVAGLLWSVYHLHHRGKFQQGPVGFINNTHDTVTPQA